MRFKTIAFALIVSSAVFILGCDDEDSSSIPSGGGRISFQLTFNPPLDSGIIVFNVLGDTLKISAVTGDHPAGNPPTGVTTRESIATEGENLLINLHATGPHPDYTCSNIRVKAMLNGIQFDVRTYNMGGVTPNDCPDGRNQSYNLIVP